ncbi:MAG TPA: mandelate racemase/muconate lactonizing enzyme family protein [Bryobacteraceae bacterium]|jgi:L-alanine-DL-glutamate epimerase-like enolase superfamily enzyme|nr:mandelate racemase/muconate lactonizing enzyme family protein [Bryobacteraceae bacterium]
MKIKNVRSFLLSYPFPEPLRLPFFGGERTILKRDAMLIRVEADHGLVGYAPGPGSERAQQAIERVVAPFLADRTLRDPDALRVQFLEGPGRDPELAKIYCCAEIALYDLVGKAMGAPVSELVGGRVRDRIRLYGSAGMYMPPERYAEEAAAIAALGFKAYKMRPALGPEKDLETVRRMREAVGPDIDLMVDAHTWWRMGDRSYSLATIEQIARDMAEYHIAWLEEPLPPDDHAAYLRLKEKDIVPLASGEHEPNEERYLDLILTQAVDYVQMDVCCQGGYALGRRLFGEIARQGLRFAFHSWGTALEVVAAAHVGICWPESVVEWLEYPCYSTPTRAGMYPFPLAAEILKDPLELDHGDLIVPRAPGLGVMVDESVVERYPWIPGPWSYFEIESPAERRAVMSDHSVQWDGEGR